MAWGSPISHSAHEGNCRGRASWTAAFVNKAIEGSHQTSETNEDPTISGAPRLTRNGAIKVEIVGSDSPVAVIS